jgi:hypothetical protein
LFQYVGHSYQVLKKRKKAPMTCSQAVSPPLGGEEVPCVEVALVFCEPRGTSEVIFSHDVFSICPLLSIWPFEEAIVGRLQTSVVRQQWNDDGKRLVEAPRGFVQDNATSKE